MFIMIPLILHYLPKFPTFFITNSITLNPNGYKVTNAGNLPMGEYNGES